MYPKLEMVGAVVNGYLVRYGLAGRNGILSR